MSVKKVNTKTFSFSPPWWSSTCTKAVKITSSLFQLYHRSGSISDFLVYSKSCVTTAQIQKKSNIYLLPGKLLYQLEPIYFYSSSLVHCYRRFKNFLIPSLHPTNDDWFDAFVSKVALYHVPSEAETSL